MTDIEICNKVLRLMKPPKLILEKKMFNNKKIKKLEDKVDELNGKIMMICPHIGDKEYYRTSYPYYSAGIVSYNEKCKICGNDKTITFEEYKKLVEGQTKKEELAKAKAIFAKYGKKAK